MAMSLTLVMSNDKFMSPDAEILYCCRLAKVAATVENRTIMPFGHITDLGMKGNDEKLYSCEGFNRMVCPAKRS